MYYSDFDEKEKYFSQSDYINTIEDLYSFVEKHKYNREFFFRGVNEAKYKLFTSAQRKWLLENVKVHSGSLSYNSFIDCLIYQFYRTRGNLMERYFKSLGLPTNDMNALCYMQHYGAPTPLLDFTTRVNVALYFATLDVEYKNTNSIDDYFSLYLLEQTNEHIVEYKERYNKLSKLTNQNKLYLVNIKSKSCKCPHFLNLAPNNLNMIAQSGVLLMNYHEFEPIESMSRIRCVNIHKSLVSNIHYYLSQKRITKRQLFPNPSDVVQDCTKLLGL